MTCSVEHLAPIETLALLNRWMKLKSYFFHADLDALYAVGDAMLKRNRASGASGASGAR